MSELRHDPFARRWVIISTERSRRPADFLPPEAVIPEVTSCPFCPGNEQATPPEIHAVRPEGSRPDSRGWEVRVFPNKYPALSIEGETERRAVGVYDRMRGVGAHEVVVESPEHGLHLGDMDVVHVEKILGAYQSRLKDLYKDKRFKYALIFKNHGTLAGDTLNHPNTQIIATPVTPRAIAMELESARQHYHVKTRCLYCDVLSQELESGERIVTADEHFVALTPYASRFPFEIMVIPRKHCYSFAEESPSSLAALARSFRDILARLKSVLRDPAYNFVFHTSPNTSAELHRTNYWATIQADFHWHIEILPRLTQVAGFEWGAGFYMNPTSPERAAAFLRDAIL